MLDHEYIPVGPLMCHYVCYWGARQPSSKQQPREQSAHWAGDTEAAKRGLPTAQDRAALAAKSRKAGSVSRLGVAYAIPIIYVSMLIITHVVAFYFVLRPLVSREWATEL